MRIIVHRERGIHRNSDGDLAGEPSLYEFEAIFAPGTASEEHHQQDTGETRAALYTDKVLVDVVRTDSIRTPEPVAGVWHVDGEPQKWVSPYTGRVAGMVIELVKVD